MGVLHDLPTPHAPEWEPEPLYLPVDEPGHGRYRRRHINQYDEPDEDGRDDDVPGSHVIVIDLA